MDYGKLCRVEHEYRKPVEAVIDEILTKGAGILYMKYVLEKQPTFIGELFSKTCGILIDDFTMAHDKGDDRKALRRFWPDDKEPVAAPSIDSWARHRVAIDKKETKTEAELSTTIDKKLKDSTSTRRGTRLDRDEYSYCADVDPEVRRRFLYAPYDRDLSSLSDNESEEVYDPKEEKIKRQLLEKKAIEEQKATYERKRAEEEKDNEKKRKEHMHSMTKKVYTFDYGGKVMYLKPTREDNIAMNEFTEIQSNHKRVPKQTNPIEGEIKVKIAETIEKETAEKTHATRGPTEGERPKKPPKIIGMFKPSPPILDIIQVASGVTISTSKNNVRRGVPVKPDGKLRFDEFKEKHRGISPTKLDDSDEARQKVNEKKERREKKYRRTIDNWKEELKKGLQDHINFDADLLINLIMTDEADGNNEKKVQRRAEREKKVNDYFDFKKKVDYFMKHPDEFLNRVAVYKKEQNTGELEDRTVVIDSKLVNQFQKAITEFNDRIVKGKDSPTQDELFQQLPMTEMEEDKYKFSKPSHMSHTNMIDIQAPRIKSAFKKTDVFADDRKFAIKRIQSGNLLRRSDSQASQLRTAALGKSASQFDFHKKPRDNPSKYVIKGSKS